LFFSSSLKFSRQKKKKKKKPIKMSMSDDDFSPKKLDNDDDDLDSSLDDDDDDDETQPSNSSSSFSSSSSSSKNIGKSRRENTPWVEKYRPSTIEELEYQEETSQTLRSAVATGNLPHLLFHGPAGSGKTSAILALANELFGKTHWKRRVLELNASDERGIDIVRVKIKNFARGAVRNDQLNAESGKRMPPFKLIILDEADSMTSAAQTALRRTIEDHSHVTRFCLICNYVSRIIDPLASRCAKFRFRPLPPPSIVARLRKVSEREGFTCADDVALKIAELSNGDMRKGIMTLQCAHMIHDSSVRPEHIVKLSGLAPGSIIRELRDAIVGTTSFERVDAAVRNIVAEGYPATGVLQQLFDVLRRESAGASAQHPLSNANICSIALALGAAEARLTDGSDELIQLLWVCSKIQQVMHR
jgi:replication factor C subunit 2/4